MKTSVKGFMFYVAFVASLGGLLFGFDTAVISGAEKAIQGIYALSDFAHGFTIATALIGTIVGAALVALMTCIASNITTPGGPGFTQAENLR